MPTAHVLRRWLWRANRVLVLVVLAVWAFALLDDPAARPLPELPAPPANVAAAPLGPDISFDEMVALVRPFHGWGERVVPARPITEPPTGGRLPLRAFELVLWIQDPVGPDSILLNSKDPAQSEAYCPKEGRPDRDVEIERIERREHLALITVTRGEERFTYPVVDVTLPTPSDDRIVRVVPTPARDDPKHRAFEGVAAARVDVKVLPYFGADGRTCGVRVTGVRPGSALARSGLRAGDVIVGIDDERTRDVERLRALLVENGGGRSLEIRRADEEKVRRLVVDS